MVTPAFTILVLDDMLGPRDLQGVYQEFDAKFNREFRLHQVTSCREARQLVKLNGLAAALLRDNLSSELTVVAKESARNLPTVMLASEIDASRCRSMLAAGVSEYLNASDLEARFLHAALNLAIIRFRAERAQTPPGGGVRQMSPMSGPELEQTLSAIAELPARERAVLDLLVAGNTPKEIGIELGTKQQTVRNQIASVRDKLQARTQVHLVSKYLTALFQAGRSSTVEVD